MKKSSSNAGVVHRTDNHPIWITKKRDFEAEKLYLQAPPVLAR
jgi:hypothetical protein